MDSITTAIVETLTAGETISNEKEIVDAYEQLKTALRQKFGASTDLIEAIEWLENKPQSQARQAMVQEEIAAARVGRDKILVNMAQMLLDSLNRRAEPLPPPLQRPLRAEKLIGRKEELANLLADLEPGRIVALNGPGGIGKSTLAAEAVWQLAPANSPPPAFSAGIIHHNFFDQPRVDIALERIVRAFGETPKPSAYDAAERILAERPALLLLDGAEQADDLPGLLAVRGNSGVLLTSRQKQKITATQHSIAPLPLDEAAALLQGSERMRGADQIAIQVICDLVGRLPLAVELIRYYLEAKNEKATKYLEWLEGTPLPGLDPLQRQLQSVSLILEHSLTQVSEMARNALAVVGLMALVPFDKEVVVGTLVIKANQGLLSGLRGIFKQKTEEQMPNVNLAIRELARYGLLRPVGAFYQISHPLIHDYARQYLPAPAQSIRQLAAYYVTLAWEQREIETADDARLEFHLPHVMKVLTECLEWEDWEAAYSLAVAIEDYLDRQELWTERVLANEIGLIASWQLGRPSEGAWLGNLGDTYRMMGHAKWAIEHFEKALATARRTGDLHSQGNSLGNLGLAYRDLGQIEQARTYLKQALPIFEKLRSPSADMVRKWLEELEEP